MMMISSQYRIITMILNSKLGRRFWKWNMMACLRWYIQKMPGLGLRAWRLRLCLMVADQQGLQIYTGPQRDSQTFVGYFQLPEHSFSNFTPSSSSHGVISPTCNMKEVAPFTSQATVGKRWDVSQHCYTQLLYVFYWKSTLWRLCLTIQSLIWRMRSLLRDFKACSQ